MIRVPAQVAAMLTGLWSVGIAYASHLHGLPEYVPYAIAAGGVLLAGLGIKIPQAPAILQAHPPAPAETPPKGAIE